MAPAVLAKIMLQNPHLQWWEESLEVEVLEHDLREDRQLHWMALARKRAGAVPKQMHIH